MKAEAAIRRDPFDALGNPHRRAILELLAKKPRSVQQIADQLPSAKKFVDAYQKKFSEMPAAYGSYQYDALKVWAAAVEKAGSLDPAKVEGALEGMAFDYSSGQSFIRKCDHQMIHPVHIMKGRAETQGDSGFRDLVISIAADEKYERTCAELGLGNRG